MASGADGSPLGGGLRVPNCSPDKLTIFEVPADTELHRVHLSKFKGHEFNPSSGGNARFSPILDSREEVIPTIYCASTFSGALMETVFHDVPYQEDFTIVFRGGLKGKAHTILTTNQPIKVAELTTKALRKLGVKPEHIVTSEKSDYEYSRSVAKAIFDKNPDIQGIKWKSRQDNSADAFVFFGSRFVTSPFNIVEDGVLLDDKLDYVMGVADEIGVLILPDY